ERGPSSSPSGARLRPWSGGELEAKAPAKRSGRFADRRKRDRRIVRVEQPPDHRAARVHPARHFGLGDVSLPHRLLELPREDALHRERGSLFQPSLFPEKVLEITPDTGICPLARHASCPRFHSCPLRCLARARSRTGVRAVFLMNPCNKTAS